MLSFAHERIHFLEQKSPLVVACPTVGWPLRCFSGALPLPFPSLPTPCRCLFRFQEVIRGSRAVFSHTYVATQLASFCLFFFFRRVGFGEPSPAGWHVAGGVPVFPGMI